MTYSLTWLAEVLEQAGLKVAEVTGWRSRGRAEMGTVRGVMCHHTATTSSGNMPSLNILVDGRQGAQPLAGPLAQLGLGRDGTFYVIAAGHANHAGAGTWEGITTGNSSFIGIEAENDGVGEPWPDVQTDAYQRGVAAILNKIGAGADMCCGHKEFATPSGRKSDPDFEMQPFRIGVAAYLSGKTPPPPIPPVDDQRRPTLRRGSSGDAVKQAQTLLMIDADGQFGPATEAALREFQRGAQLVPDGILGPKTWAKLSAAPASGAPGANGGPLAEASVRPGAVPAAVVPPALPSFIPSALPPADTSGARPKVEGSTALGPDGTRFARTFKQGFYTSGSTTVLAWLKTRPSLPPDISASRIRVVSAMSANEGDFEAINSYDDAHLSVGMLQWTAGSGDGPGEMAALLARFKQTDADAFEDCFGRYDLGALVAGPNSTDGRLTLNGEPLDTSIKKDVLRTVLWAYRFWRASHHPSLRLCQFALAASRIDRFKNLDVCGKPLQAWLTSELGMSLVLDEHVNRPGHVPDTLVSAVKRLGLAGADPNGFSGEQEHQLISEYLDQRAKTNMTDSPGRATKIMHFVTLGLLSDQRKSFG